MTLIPCPHCGKMTIEVREIPNTILIKRGFTGKKGRQFFRGRDVYLTNKCSECGKDSLKNDLDNDKIRKRIMESGMPTSYEIIGD
jgi:endogenous inhibitor of DNA gyrase (YacG/DUF329 family)